MVAIIGVLAAVAIPAYNKYRNDAAQASAQAEATGVMKALQACQLVSDLATCYDATGTVAMTLSKACTNPSTLTTGKATAAGCIYHQALTDGCASATVAGAGATLEHYCIQIDTSSGLRNTTNTGENMSCNNMGLCI